MNNPNENIQFLGVWYAIQKTTTASTCLIYNVTRGEEPGEYFIEQTSQNFALGLTPLKHEYSYTGVLSVPDQDIPAKMRVKFPLSKCSRSEAIHFFLSAVTRNGMQSGNCRLITHIRNRI